MASVWNQCSELTSNLTPIEFHSLTGKNMVLSNDKLEALKNAEYFQGYVFTALPIILNENYLIRIRSINPTNKKSTFKNMNALNFGITDCNPQVLQQSALPYDTKSLLKRYEYWNYKNIYTLFPPTFHDFIEFRFTIQSNGDVKVYNYNSQQEHIIFQYGRLPPSPQQMYKPLWVFLEIFDSTQILRLFKIQNETNLPNLANNNNVYNINSRNIGFSIESLLEAPYSSVHISRICQVCNNEKLMTITLDNYLSICADCHKACYQQNNTTTDASIASAPLMDDFEDKTKTITPTTTASIQTHFDKSKNTDKLCVICLDDDKTHAILPCGHLCLCSSCSEKIRKEKCPVCKVDILDIYRIYS